MFLFFFSLFAFANGCVNLKIIGLLDCSSEGLAQFTPVKGVNFDWVTQVDLQNNKLVRVDVGTIKMRMKNLAYIVLTGNPQLDCHFF